MNIQGLVVVYRKELGTGITQTAITIKIYIIFFFKFRQNRTLLFNNAMFLLL